MLSPLQPRQDGGGRRGPGVGTARSLATRTRARQRPGTRGERESGSGGGGRRMQGKKPGGSSGGGRSGELQGDEAQRNKKKKKKVSCFSNITIFLVSECALMLAQGTVGAYLVSPRANSAAGPLPPPGARAADWHAEGTGGRDLRPVWRLANGAEAAAGRAAGPGCRASLEPADRGCPQLRLLPAGAGGDPRRRGRGAGGRETSPLPLQSAARGRVPEPPRRGRRPGFQVTCTWEEKPVSILHLLLSISSAQSTNPLCIIFSGRFFHSPVMQGVGGL